MKVIVRHTKHHTLGTIKAAASHTMRTRPTPNADPDAPAPEVWIGSEDPAADMSAVLPKKRRKNAVLAIEYLITASPEFFKAQPEEVWRKYLKDQLEMIKGYYDKSNVVSAVLHLDETTPHLSVQVVPLVNGKLNARSLIGTREACSILQDLAGDVGQPYALERGLRGSKAVHKDIKQWYEELKPAMGKAIKTIAEADQKMRALSAQSVLIEQRKKALEKATEAINQERKRLAAEMDRLDLLAQAMTPEQESKAFKKLDALKEAKEAQNRPTEPVPSHTTSSKTIRSHGYKPR